MKEFDSVFSARSLQVLSDWHSDGSTDETMSDAEMGDAEVCRSAANNDVIVDEACSEWWLAHNSSFSTDDAIDFIGIREKDLYGYTDGKNGVRTEGCARSLRAAVVRRAQAARRARQAGAAYNPNNETNPTLAYENQDRMKRREWRKVAVVHYLKMTNRVPSERHVVWNSLFEDSKNAGFELGTSKVGADKIEASPDLILYEDGKRGILNMRFHIYTNRADKLYVLSNSAILQAALMMRVHDAAFADVVYWTRDALNPWRIDNNADVRGATQKLVDLLGPEIEVYERAVREGVRSERLLDDEEINRIVCESLSNSVDILREIKVIRENGIYALDVSSMHNPFKADCRAPTDASNQRAHPPIANPTPASEGRRDSHAKWSHFTIAKLWQDEKEEVPRFALKVANEWNRIFDNPTNLDYVHLRLCPGVFSWKRPASQGRGIVEPEWVPARTVEAGGDGLPRPGPYLLTGRLLFPRFPFTSTITFD